MSVLIPYSMFKQLMYPSELLLVSTGLGSASFRGNDALGTIAEALAHEGAQG